MADKFTVRTAAQVYLIRDEGGGRLWQALFYKRKDCGLWDTIGGHREEGESLMQAAQRVALKEYGITFDEVDVEFATIIDVGKHNITGQQYVTAHFFIRRWGGEPKICEPEKMGEMRWMDVHSLDLLDGLPELNFDRKQALSNFLRGVGYSQTMF
ncbi:NUDIX domain-containing protein [Candidatus Saccharibacteria bacterium]|nr:NUDIX domain-containing protein [Candidatus Saccharibacteria bacterium]